MQNSRNKIHEVSSSGGKAAEDQQKKSKSRSIITEIEEKMKKAEQQMNHFVRERDKLLEEIRKNPLHYSKERNIRLKGLQIKIEEAESEWCSLQEKLDKL